MTQDSGIVAPELLAGVRALLKNNPKGMSVSDIAAGLGMNRNSTAKYLDILSVGGQIEMRAFGPAKVYFLSQRVPLGAILNYTAEYILIIDQHYRILQVNDRFLEYSPHGPRRPARRLDRRRPPADRLGARGPEPDARGALRGRGLARGSSGGRARRPGITGSAWSRPRSTTARPA